MPDDFEALIDHPIYAAAELGRFRKVRALLDADQTVLDRQDRFGGTPLHRAVLGRSPHVVKFLLDRGADIHAPYGAGRPAFTSYPPQYSEPIDLAIWGGARCVHDPMWLNGLRWVRWCLPRLFRQAPQRHDIDVASGPCDGGDRDQAAAADDHQVHMLAGKLELLAEC